MRSGSLYAHLFEAAVLVQPEKECLVSLSHSRSFEHDSEQVIMTQTGHPDRLVSLSGVRPDLHQVAPSTPWVRLGTCLMTQ